MDWISSLPDELRKEPVRILFAGLIRALAVVLLPSLLLLGLNDFFTRENIKREELSLRAEMSKLLGDLTGAADPQQRFNKVFRELGEIPFPSPTFERRLKQILAETPGAFEIYFFDAQDKCFALDFLPKPPKFVAQKFMTAVRKKHCDEKDEKWLVQFSGYKRAHISISSGQNSIVKIGRTDDRQWGGLFPLKTTENNQAGSFIVFIRKSAIDQDKLLFAAVKNANQKYYRNFAFAWWDPLEPDKVFPEGRNFSQDTPDILKKMPAGETDFAMDGHHGQINCTKSGITLLVLAKQKVEPGAFSIYVDLAVKIGAVTFFIVLFPIFLGITVVKPGLKAKITAVLLLGSGSCMVSLLFTGVIDRSDREKVLTSRYQADNVEELRRIDEGLLYEYKRIERLLRSRISKVEKLDKEEFVREVKLYWQNLGSFADRFKELVIVGSRTPLRFAADSDTPGKNIEENSGVMYGEMILQTYQGRFITPERDAQSHNLRDVIHNSSSTFSRNLILKGGRFENLSLADNSIPTYIDFFIGPDNQGRAILLAFLSRASMQRNYLLTVSRLFDQKQDRFQPRLVAVPTVPSIEWPAFPKRNSARHEVLKEIAQKVVFSELPVHQKAVINGREFLLSAMKGKNLDGYTLILARPYQVVAEKIAHLNRNMLILAIFIITLACSLAWFASSLLLKPIAKIRALLTEIGRGNFRVSLKPEAVAEFNQVASSLNHTIESFHEIKVASNIQEHLWPDKGLNGPDWELEGICETATELGGDHFDWLRLADGRILLTIGDVTGHGIGAAMVQASMKVWVALKAVGCKDSAQLLAEINRLHCTYGAKKLPMSFWAGYYLPETGELDFASAGQSYPILVDADGGIETLKQPGMPLGIRLKNRYQACRIVLKPGQKLVLYTDGIVETADEQGKMLGFSGLENLVSKFGTSSSLELIHQILASARDWGEQNDDRTIVVLSRFKKEKSNEEQ